MLNVQAACKKSREKKKNQDKTLEDELEHLQAVNKQRKANLEELKQLKKELDLKVKAILYQKIQQFLNQEQILVFLKTKQKLNGKIKTHKLTFI